MYTGKLAVLLLFFTALVVPTLPASAATLACGDTVSADVVLTRNLTCVGTALHVARDTPGTIHINLAGHTLRGNGTGEGINAGEPYYSHVTSLSVTGGIIAGFAKAIGTDGRSEGFTSGGPLTIDHLRMQNNGTWMDEDYEFTNVTNSTIINSGAAGAHVEGRFTVQNTRLINSSVSAYSESYSYLYGDTFNGGGFYQGDSANVIATGNTFRNCATGMEVTDVWPWGTSQIENNQFIGCRMGLDLNIMDGTITVKNNTFKYNTGNGFTFVTRADGHATVTGNTFRRNGGDGLAGTGYHGESIAGVNVGGNKAIGNAGHGINAQGVTDGGGNVAARNGASPPCIGVACSPPVSV
jgi:Right handed beta helix region